MKVRFIDEVEDLGVLPDPPQPTNQPVLVVDGLTDDFLSLKYRCFPNLPCPSARPLRRILPDIQGTDLCGNATRENAHRYLRATGQRNAVLMSR